MAGLLRAGLLAGLLTGCGSRSQPARPDTAGARLERAALGAGLIDDPASVDSTGVFRSDADSVCVVPAGQGYRIGVVSDYGEGQGCVARGTATGRAALAVTLGDACRFEARVENGRIAFPAAMPAACNRFCTGRASLAALSAERLGTSAAEAGALRAPDGSRPCDG